MVNYGLAYMGDRQLNFGQPFIAAFDRFSGKKLFLTMLNDTDGPIQSFRIKDNAIFVLSKNKIMKYSMITGNLLAEKEFPAERYGALEYFVGGQVFITNQDGVLESLPQSDSTKVFVFTGNSQTLSIDENLEIATSIEFDDVSIYYLHKNDYRFLAKGNKTFIINEEGRSIAEIEATSGAFMIENTLYDKKDKSLIAIDLHQLFTID